MNVWNSIPGRVGLMAPVVALVANGALGQPAPAAMQGTEPSAAATARYQIRVMEGVLERAVQHGAQVVGTQMRQFAPDVMLFSGPARARGVRLDGYGVFFSVEVPAVRRSMTWSFRTLSQQASDLNRAIQSLRRHVQASSDVQSRAELEQALKLVELQAVPTTVPGREAAAAARDAARRPTTTTGTAPQAGAEDAPSGPRAVLADPSAAYEEQVKRAIVDAMIDYGAPLAIGGDEWLTVAARDTEDGMLGSDLSDTVTIVFRVKGADLAGFRAGTLTRDEARQRVEVNEF